MSHVPLNLLTVVHEIYKRVANGSLNPETVRASLQAIVEKQPLSSSSLSTKVIATCEGVDITEAFLAQTMTWHGTRLKRHRNGGGWVPVEQSEDDETMPFVAETAYVGPHAMVYGKARILDMARLISPVNVCGNARVEGEAVIARGANVGGKVRFFGQDSVFGGTHI